MSTERVYKRGDEVKVVAYKMVVLGTEVVLDGFNGTVIKEHIKQDGGVVVDMYEQGGGIRTVPKEHVKDLSDKSIKFDGVYYKIRCADCGAWRDIKPQHLSQIKRCKRCQKLFNQSAAKMRAKHRRDR